jgi:hypothetical protein
MKVQHRNIDVIQQLRMVFDRVAAGEEYDDFLLRLLIAHVLFQERKEQKESSVGRADNISLRKSRDCARVLLAINVDMYRARAERYPCEVCDFGSLSRRE